ncbi:hypothetical protein [Candidatus Amarolinea aalborgensis]|uniref:hypothetical protein n=1 Tax=Candidatus Amarolinea aalborgensis TaxID=2249329 RepID=UPI003BF9BA6B
MNRHTLVYLVMSLFIGLTTVSLLFDALPLAQADASLAPVGLTETFTPTDTPITPAPTETPTMTPAPTETPTMTPAPTETPTMTPAPTETPTMTPAPTETPTMTPAPTQTPTMTGTPIPTSTPGQAPTNTPAPSPTGTPTAFVGLPVTGAAAPQGEAFPWLLMWAAAAVGSLGLLAFGLSNRARRPTRR